MRTSISTTLCTIAAGLALGLPTSLSAADMSIKGEVDSFRIINLRTQQGEREHGLVRVILENGRSAIIDLGDRRQAQNIDLEQGDRITVAGSKHHIQGKPVIKAERLRIDGEKQLSHKQGQQGQQQSRQSQDQRQHQQQRNQQQAIVVSGKPMQGKKAGSHTILKIKSDNGRTVIIDLPAGFDVTDAELQQADHISIQGTPAKIQDQQILRVVRLKVDGQEIQRSDQGQQQANRRQQNQRQQQISRSQKQQHGRQHKDQHQSQQQQASFSGTLDGFSKVQLRNAREENVFARLRLQDGSSRIVDLGNISSVKALQLDRGDHVTIKGKERSLNGKRILEARSLKISNQRAGNTDRYVRSGNEGLRNQESVMFQGTVEGLKKQQVKGQDAKVTVMKLKLKDGKDRLLNISPWMANKFLDIDKGDEVVVSGQRHQTKSGKNVVIIDGILVLEGQPTVSSR